MKTSESTKAVLNWAVAKCEGATDEWSSDEPFFWDGVPCIRIGGHDVNYRPSTDWEQGGLLIEREGIEICRLNSGEWRGQLYEQGIDKMHREYGPTPLIAAMRCFVVSKLGDEVNVPDDLNKEQA
jgi:hypothetical protein